MLFSPRLSAMSGEQSERKELQHNLATSGEISLIHHNIDMDTITKVSFDQFLALTVTISASFLPGEQ